MALLAALLLTASAVQAPAGAGRIEITLERTQCYGTCPVYSIRIVSDGGDGTIEYAGREYVRVSGAASSRISRAAIQRLVDAAERAGYFALADNYERIVNPDGTITSVSDLPTTTTSFRVGQRFKKVVDYVGAPPALKELEHEIDRVARTARWVSIDAPTVEQMARTGWRAGGEEGRKYLAEAVERGDVETVDALILAGADPNPANFPLLMMTADDAVLKKLVDRGANVNAMWNGLTPLMMAARAGDAAKVELLLKLGAAPTALSNDGKTALEIAQAQQAVPPPPPSPFGPEPPRDLARVIQLLRAAAK